MNLAEQIGVNKALKNFGGFVRYYDTTEPLQDLATLVSDFDCRDALVCCGGGDQALTILGASRGKGYLLAVDVNPGQLFVLAAKALFIKQKHELPSFKQLQQAYPGKLRALKKNIQSLQHMLLYHMATGKMIVPPARLSEEYALVTDGGIFILPDSGPFWKNDRLFIARVRARLGSMIFSKKDIFDSPDYVKQGSLDLIYMSNVFWPDILPYYQEKLVKMVGLLRPGGRIISYFDVGGDFLGCGVSPSRLLVQLSKHLGLKVVLDQVQGYLVLERMKRRG